MSQSHKLSVALLIIRVSATAFLGVWVSLKFYRPEWMVNVFRNIYKLDFITQDYAIAVGSIPSLLFKFTDYPSNLLWSAVPTLGALIALFILRDHDQFTIDG